MADPDGYCDTEKEMELSAPRLADGLWSMTSHSIKAQKGDTTDEYEEKIDSSQPSDENDEPSTGSYSEHTDSESTMSMGTMSDEPTETYNTSSTPMDTDEISMSDETEEDSEEDSTGEESAVDSDMDDTEEVTDDDSYNSDDTEDSDSEASSYTDRPSSESSDGTSSGTPPSEDPDHTDTDLNDENKPIEIPEEFTVRPPKVGTKSMGKDVIWGANSEEKNNQDAFIKAVNPTDVLLKGSEYFGTSAGMANRKEISSHISEYVTILYL